MIDKHVRNVFQKESFNLELKWESYACFIKGIQTRSKCMNSYASYEINIVCIYVYVRN